MPSLSVLDNLIVLHCDISKFSSKICLSTDSWFVSECTGAIPGPAEPSGTRPVNPERKTVTLRINSSFSLRLRSTGFGRTGGGVSQSCAESLGWSGRCVLGRVSFESLLPSPCVACFEDYSYLGLLWTCITIQLLKYEKVFLVGTAIRFYGTFSIALWTRHYSESTVLKHW